MVCNIRKHVEELYVSESAELGEGGGKASGAPRELRVVQLRGVAGKALGALIARLVIVTVFLTVTVTSSATVPLSLHPSESPKLQHHDTSPCSSQLPLIGSRSL